MGSKYTEIVKHLRTSFKTGQSKSIDFRIRQLKSLLRMLDENEDVLVKAIYKDLQKPRSEAIIMEVEYVRNDIRGMLYNIRRWSSPQKTDPNLLLILDKSFVHNEPYGVVLVIGAWNYPIQLALGPVVGAIAAGNSVILKPSELSPTVAATLEQLIPQYLDKDFYTVVCGGSVETTQLLKERFDYIFYTGGVGVGKIIRAAANEHLTPVTLELGGKSPLYIDSTVNMDIATKRILWGKYSNAGQTCVSPDYVLCTLETRKILLESLKRNLVRFFGEEPQRSEDLGRIVNDRHFERIMKLINSGVIVIGGQSDKETRYIAPTILVDVKPTDPIMQEEIFGPLLPILTISGPEEAMEFINEREKALSLYVFSTDKAIINTFMKKSSSGSLCVNDTVVHLSIDSLPFGGVGMSGMGRYHGKYSFETFSHQKAVLIRNYNALGENISKARYPPQSEDKINYLLKLVKKRPNMLPSGISYVLVFALGVITAAIVSVIINSAR